MYDFMLTLRSVLISIMFEKHSVLKTHHFQKHVFCDFDYFKSMMFSKRIVFRKVLGRDAYDCYIIILPSLTTDGREIVLVDFVLQNFG